MFQARVFLRSTPDVTLVSKTETSQLGAREWAEGYLRRHPELELDWEFV